MLTFVCWLWEGWRPIYDASHVNALNRMLKRHVSVPHRLVCITDNAEGIECESFPLWTIQPARFSLAEELGKKIVPNCFVRLKMFDPKIGRLFGPRIVSLDLDCVILQDISSLFDNDYDFIASRGYRSHICGSMWQLVTGSNENVWRSYDPVESPKTIAAQTYGRHKLSGSDQAWMSLCMPDAPVWGEREGVYQFMEMRPQSRVPRNARIVFFAGMTKPWSESCRIFCPDLYKAYWECVS